MAGNRIWTGAGNNGNWNNSTNWGGTPVASGDDLQFDSTSTNYFTNTNNLANNFLISKLRFTTTSNSFTLVSATNGNFISRDDFTLNTSTNTVQTININMSNTAAALTTDTTNGGTTVFGGTLSGFAPLLNTLAGSSGTNIFLASNNFTGILTNGAGVLRIANSSALGVTNAGTVISNNAALELITNSAGSNISIGAEALTIRGTGINSGGALRNIAGDNVFGGLITLASASEISSDSGTLFLTNTGTITGATFGLTFGGAGNVSVAGIISNTTGSLTKEGAGTLFLTASNRFTGGTVINAGTIAISNNGAFASNNVTFASNGTTVVALTGLLVTNNYALTGNGTMDVGSFNLTNSGIISNTGSLTKAGAGTLILGRANTYSGGTTINAGTVAISNAASFGSNTVIFASNGTTVAALASILVTNNYALTGNGTMDVGAFILTNSGAISGAGSLTKAGAGTMVLSRSNNFSGTTTVGAGVLSLANTNALGGSTLDYSSAGAISFSNLTGANLGGLQGSTNLILTNLAGTAVALNVGANNSSTTYSGALSGGGSLTKSGTGTLALSGTNTYSGGTLVSAGALSGDSTSLQGSVTNNAAVIFNQSTNGTYAGALSGSGTLVKNGAGTVTLSGSNSYAGATTISNGAVRISNANGLGATNGGTTVTNGAALEVDGGITIGAEALTLGGSGLSSSGALRSITGSNTYGGLISAGTSMFIGVDAGSLTLTGGVTNGAGSSFTKVGAGTLILNSSDTTTGIHVISGGTLQLGGSGSIGPVAMNVTNGSTFDLNGRNATLGSSGNLNVHLTGATIKSGAGTLSLNSLGVTVSSVANANSSTISGNLNLGGATNTFDVADGAAAEDLVISAAISNGGLIKTNTGTLVLSGANTYSGGTLVSAGALSGNTTSLQGNITNSASVVFDQSSDGIFSGVLSGLGSLVKTNAGKLTFTGANSQGGTTIAQGTLQVGNGGTTGSLGGNITNNATLAFNRSDNLTQSSLISGSGSVSKLGAGTLTLSGSNSFAGTTVVSAGTLNLNSSLGSAAGSTASVSVATGATLLISQNNQVNNAATVSVSGGTIKSAGGVSEVFGNLTVGTASFLDFGATSYATASSISFGTYTPSALLTLNNFDFGSTLVFKSDLSSSITNSSFFAVNNGGISSYSWNSGTSTFTITAIPEPSAYVAAIGLLAMMLWPLRRKLAAVRSAGRKA